VLRKRNKFIRAFESYPIRDPSFDVRHYRNPSVCHQKWPSSVTMAQEPTGVKRGPSQDNLVDTQPTTEPDGCCGCCFDCTPCCPGGLAECCVITCANPCTPEPIKEPRTYMWFSVCCLLFNPLFGLFAIYYSCTARRAREKDDQHDHLIRGRCALLFIIWGFIFSIFVGILVALVLAMTPQNWTNWVSDLLRTNLKKEKFVDGGSAFCFKCLVSNVRVLVVVNFP